MRGGERQSLFLHSALLERGIKSILVCKKHGELASLGIKNTVPLQWHGEADLLALLGLLRICQQKEPTIIHCHDAHALTHGGIAGKLLSVPVVYTRRVAFPIKKSLLTKWKYHACAAVIAVSKTVAQQCREVVSASRVHVVGDVVDVSCELLPRAQARKALGLREDAFVIGSVAHFTKEKNIGLIVECCKRLLVEKPLVQIVCIGPTELQSADIPPNCICPGKLQNAVQYYNAFDAYMSTSSREGLGSALLDAVVRDIPAIAVDAGGTRDLFPDNWPLVADGDKNGLYDAVICCIDHFNEHRQSAAAVGKWARDLFSMSVITEKTLQLYKTLYA
jgi:glycosyltransferase involved in cell wall biosynthesis